MEIVSRVGFICTHLANGNLGQEDYDRLRLSSEMIEKLYVATMNFYYLQAVYELSLVRIDSQPASQEPPTPKKNRGCL